MVAGGSNSHVACHQTLYRSESRKIWIEGHKYDDKELITDIHGQLVKIDLNRKVLIIPKFESESQANIHDLPLPHQYIASDAENLHNKLLGLHDRRKMVAELFEIARNSISTQSLYIGIFIALFAILISILLSIFSVFT